MTTDTCVVRVWLEPSGRRDPVRADGSVRLLVHGPYTPGTVAVLRSTPVGSAPGCHGAETPVDEHLRAGPAETDERWLAVADVIVTSRHSARPADVFTRFPGCLVVAFADSGRGYLVVTATGGRIRFNPAAAERCAGGAVAPYASLVHAWLTAGRPLAALDAAHVARPGRRGARVSVRDPGQEDPGTCRRAGA